MRNSTPSRINGKAINSAKAAASWLALGIAPVPLVAGTKRPKGEDKGSGKRDATGWNLLRVTEETLGHFFKRGDNIGGLWGEPSGWVIDVDLDTPEAIIASRIFLPETYMYGRAGAVASHYLYRCENAQTRKYQTKEIGTIVEIRSTGTQSVLPPSLHPSQERYRIDHDVPIETIGIKDLEERVRQLAAAALCAYYYPDKGSRHDFIHALTGSLLWKGWQDAEIRRFMKAVCAAGGSNDHERADRDGSIENTIEHFKKGDRIQGWPSLSAFMPGMELDALKKWLAFSKMPDNSVVAPDMIEAEAIPQIKGSLLELPGLVGRIAAWASKQSYTKQPLFEIATGLMSVALASGNKYVVAGWRTPLQPYIMMLAPTASGKESASDLCMEIAAKIGLQNAIVSGFQSFHSLLDVLSKPPHTICWHWDEAARKLRTAGRAQGGPDYQVLTYLLQLYGKANKTVAGLPGRKTAIEAIDRPFFTVLAAAQPSQLLEAITTSDLSLGLINRFLLLDAGSEMARTNETRDNTFPAAIERELAAMQKVRPRPIDAAKGIDGFIHIGYETQEAYEIFNDFQVAAREWAAKEQGQGEMWGRANQNALIYAGIVAVGVNPKRPMITVEVAQWAVEFVSWSVERWIARIDQSASRSVTEAASKSIERMIRGVRELAMHCRTNREGELVAKGKMPRAMITRLSRHLKAKDLDDVLASLILADIIGTSDEQGIESYWVKQTGRKVIRLTMG